MCCVYGACQVIWTVKWNHINMCFSFFVSFINSYKTLILISTKMIRWRCLATFGKWEGWKVFLINYGWAQIFQWLLKIITILYWKVAKVLSCLLIVILYFTPKNILQRQHISFQQSVTVIPLLSSFPFLLYYSTTDFYLRRRSILSVK